MIGSFEVFLHSVPIRSSSSMPYSRACAVLGPERQILRMVSYSDL